MLTGEQRKKVAHLNSNSGFAFLLDEVVKARVDEALKRIRGAKKNYERLEAAREYSIWAEVYETLKEFPRKAEEEMKEKGEMDYGL